MYFNPLILNTRAKSTDTQITHRVRSGQTLSHIAYRYGVRIADIKYWNGLRSDRIMPNQRLIIYTDRNAAPRASSQNSGTAAAQGNLITHTVRRGETLGGIAEKYGVSAANIRSWNNMRSSTIYAGGTLKIYTSATLATSHDGDFEYYTVKSGDNLWDIANKLGITVQNIRSLNGLGSGSRIYPGQKLKVRKM